MSVIVDPRMEQRRREVRERRARRSLRWVLLILALALAGTALWWLAYSPILALERIEVAGTEGADGEAAVAAADIELGMPIWKVRSGAVADAFLADPWVADVRVRVVFPHGLEVTVLEHRPVAAVRSGDEWIVAAADGAVVTVAAEPDEGLARIQGAAVDAAPGTTIADGLVRGGIEFAASLVAGPEGPIRIAILRDELWAEVEGHRVRLGRPTDMVDKALVLEVMLAEAPDPAMLIDLVAPTRPALVPTAGASDAGGPEGGGLGGGAAGESGQIEESGETTEAETVEAE